MRPVTAALLLDMDDTLIDTKAAMVTAGAVAVATLWPEAGDEVQHAAGLRFHGDPAGFFGRFNTGEQSFAEMREARVADLVEVFSFRAIDDVIRRFEDAYAPAFFANMRLFDDVLPLVTAATAAGIPIGLLTNSASDYTQRKLEIAGLEGVFAVVATRDTLGFGKPDPRAFRHACELLGAAPNETLYVGDHVEIDAIAAKDAGLYAVWLRRDRGDRLGALLAHAHGIPVVGSLKEVAALLA
jgi:putative hydrolase of the HAD superfamily